MVEHRPPTTWWSLLIGPRSWSLLGGVGAVFAVGVGVLLLVFGGMLDVGRGIAVGAVVLLICAAFGAYAFYNLLRETRLEGGEQRPEERPKQREGLAEPGPVRRRRVRRFRRGEGR